MYTHIGRMALISAGGGAGTTSAPGARRTVTVERGRREPGRVRREEELPGALPKLVHLRSCPRQLSQPQLQSCVPRLCMEEATPGLHWARRQRRRLADNAHCCGRCKLHVTHVSAAAPARLRFQGGALARVRDGSDIHVAVRQVVEHVVGLRRRRAALLVPAACQAASQGALSAPAERPSSWCRHALLQVAKGEMRAKHSAGRLRHAERTFGHTHIHCLSV